MGAHFLREKVFSASTAPPQRRRKQGKDGTYMGETIMLILVLLLALYGCMELIRRAAVRIMRPSGPRSGILVLPLSGHCGDVEYQIRAAASQNSWGGEMTGTVLILDAGMDEETRALAEKVCADYPSVRLEKSPELEKMFGARLQKEESGL